MLERLPLHPLLVAAVPVLLLWWQNADEVAPDEALGALWPILVAVTIGTIVASLIVRSARRGALIVSVGAFLYLGYGHLWGQDRSTMLGLAVWALLLAVASVWAVQQSDADAASATRVTNVVSALLVVALVPAVWGSGSTDVAASDTVAVAPDGQPLRDIVYIIPDRYGRDDGLSETFGIDNSAFTDALRARKMQVLTDVQGNYPRTSHSLASTLAMEYLDDVVAAIGTGDRSDLGPVYGRLRDHRVGRVLTEAGYEYIHLGSWWSPTSTADDADIVLSYDTRSEFDQVLRDTTMAPAIASFGPAAAELTGRDRVRNTSAWQLDQLDRLAQKAGDRPRFIFAHITLPHEPYVFDANGDPVDADTERSQSRAQNYGDQLIYLNGRLLAIVDELLDRPVDTQPIVLIQSDEGPHTERQEMVLGDQFRWEDATDAELRTKLRLLSAWHLPGVDVAVPNDLSPVNSFRLIMDTYLGTELGLLEDRSYIYPDMSDLYTFTDVTERVRG